VGGKFLLDPTRSRSNQFSTHSNENNSNDERCDVRVRRGHRLRESENQVNTHDENDYSYDDRDYGSSVCACAYYSRFSSFRDCRILPYHLFALNWSCNWSDSWNSILTNYFSCCSRRRWIVYHFCPVFFVTFTQYLSTIS
jgi:hypothetical protein